MQQESDKLQAISLRHGSAAHPSGSAMVARMSSVTPNPQLSQEAFETFTFGSDTSGTELSTFRGDVLRYIL